MSFNFFKIEIKISYLFVCIITVFVATDQTGMFLPLSASVLLHEMAHVIALIILGCRVKSIKLVLGEIGIEHLSPPTKNERMISLLSGPALNLISAPLFYITDNIVLFGINFILGAINLLPIIGLDGGSIIEVAFEGLLCQETVKAILIITTILMIICILVANYLYLNGNYSVWLFCIYLILPIILKLVLKEKKIYCII